ncbi:PREDICTED: putative methyltransferase NSUN6 isoform X2 [Gekko japonicus]|uniref:Methyltransferase NSUN6 isoform X2 n=1 Tax=Gekko japonicus TaxID=146911 RepID=A0ABM1K8Q9_GEKJA|nr:PREDICTED: putative methyltransferase NSUN6 isoform X2 [Gekko japonicus]
MIRFFCKPRGHPNLQKSLFGLISAVGPLEVERKYEHLLNNLSHPPAFTTVRVNTHLASVEHIRSLLSEEIRKQYKGFSVPFLQHPKLPDILLIPIIGPRKDLQELTNQVIVGAQCGNAVLRGAHVYAPGIISTSKFMKAGDVVSVYSDIEGKCKRGAKEFLGTKVFLGNGISEVGRNDIFNSNAPLKGLGVKMIEPIYLSPSFDNVLSSYIFLQNLPSSVVSYVLNPQPGERILDMCAAPGGKTTHLATLMHDEEPHVGGEGMMGAGLSPEQLKQLQRFDPSDAILQGMDFNSLEGFRYEDMIKLANKDCIGFFIAKFIKVQ